MIATIHQPEYLPWLGFFDRICKSDIFVVLDDVGYQKNGFINRNKIKTAKGGQWITVPVKGRSPNLKINEVFIDNEKKWQEQQLGLLDTNYSKAPHFRDYFPFFEDAFLKKWDKISDLDFYLIENILKFLDVKVKIAKSSDLKIEGKSAERLVNILKHFGAGTYLSGPGGKNYMDLSLFKKDGIEVVFQEFSHPKYFQQFAEKGFLPYMSVVDLLFCCGPDSKNIIKNKI